jgi:MFS family permease
MAQTAPDAARWRVLAILCAAILFCMATWFSATAVVPELTAAWALTPGQAALLTNAVQAGFVTGALGASFINLFDLVPVRTVMTIAAAAAALSNALLLLADGVVFAAIARFLTGVALAGVYPSGLKLAATWFSRNRGLALGCMIAALTLGSASPYLVRGTVSVIAWKPVVASASAAALAGAALLVLFAREGPYPFSRARFDPRQAGRILRDRPLFLANLGYFGHMWELYAMWAWFLTYARSVLAGDAGWSASAIALLAFAVIGAGAIGCIGGGLIADRFGRTAAAILMLTASGMCAALIGFAAAGPVWLFCAVALVWGITIVGDSAQFSAMVTELSEQSLAGTALALQLGIGFLLTIGAIRLLPVVAAALGSWRFAFLAVVPGPVVGVLAMAALRRLPESRAIALGKR